MQKNLALIAKYFKKLYKPTNNNLRSDCPKLKNGNQGNQARNGNAVARAYVVGSVGTNPNSNVVT
ncbi:hypothetical protein Tco_0230132, partial [Tanacetum coccineum]